MGQGPGKPGGFVKLEAVGKPFLCEETVAYGEIPDRGPDIAQDFKGKSHSILEAAPVPIISLVGVRGDEIPTEDTRCRHEEYTVKYQAFFTLWAARRNFPDFPNISRVSMPLGGIFPKVSTADGASETGPGETARMVYLNNRPRPFTLDHRGKLRQDDWRLVSVSALNIRLAPLPAGMVNGRVLDNDHWPAPPCAIDR